MTTIANLLPRERDRSYPGLTLLVTSLGTFVAILDTSIVNLALHTIQADLRCSLATLQWVMDAYTLIYAAFILTGGALGDRYGRRRVFLLGMAVFGLGSLLCALASSSATLLLGRCLGGLGAALELPTSLAILNVTFEGARRSRAIAAWASANGLAMAVGPTAGGALVAVFGWRSLFYVVLPFVVATMVLALGAVRESRRDARANGLDLPGQALAIVALAAVCVGLIQAPDWGWGSSRTIAAFVVGAVATGLFVVRERNAATAMLPPDLFGNRIFSAGLLEAALMTTGFYVFLFVFPLFLQVVRGRSALQAGLDLLPMSLTFFAVSSLATGRLVSRFGPRVAISSGMALSAMGIGALGLPAARASDLVTAACLVASGVGVGLMTGPVSNLPVANAPRDRSGVSSGAVNVARMIGATIGVALAGSFVGQRGHGSASVAIEQGMSRVMGLAACAHALGAALALRVFGRSSLDG